MSRVLFNTIPLTVLAVASCSRLPQPPVIDHVEPTAAVEGEQALITIFGEFYVGARISAVDSSRSRISTDFLASLGELALDEVTYVGFEELTAVVSASVPIGTYSLTVVDPNGRAGTLYDAFVVWARQVTNGMPCVDDAGCRDRCHIAGTCVDGSCVIGAADKDADGDGLVDETCPEGTDCDDNNPNCSSDCTDNDGDTFCVTHDCDDDPLACGIGCFPTNPAIDICDTYDQDCDGSIDEDAYAFAKTITINRAEMDDPACGVTLLDFPLLYSVIDTDLLNNVRDLEGDDIIFVGTDDTTCRGMGPAPCTLDHEIETWAPGTGELVAWVRVPSVNTTNAGSDTTIEIRYGNSMVTTSTENIAAVWDASFQSVWHLNQDPGPGAADDMADSTQNLHHATAHSALVSGDSVSAKIGQGVRFQGAGNFIEDADAENYIDGLTAFTLSAWIQSDVIGSDDGFVTAKAPDGTDSGFGLRYDDVGKDGGGNDVIKAGVPVGGEKTLESSALVQTTSWQHVTLTWASGGQLTLYLDGVLDVATDNAAAFSGSVSGTNTFLIGVGGKNGPPTPGTGGWAGVIDEVRISDIARDACWIDATFDNQNLPGDVASPGFYTVGPQVTNC